VRLARPDGRLIDHQRHGTSQILESQGAVEQIWRAGVDLSRSVARTTSVMAHGRIVDRAGKLVAGTAVAPPDHKIAEVLARHKALRAKVAVDETQSLRQSRHAEAPFGALGVSTSLTRAGQLRI